MHEFVHSVPAEEQFKYALNTFNYKNGLGFDSRFVLLSRRSIPSEQPKPESFWTDEHRIALLGLTQEMPLGSADRMHTVIMITTLNKLEEHGRAENIEPGADGEYVIDPIKPFNDFLFTYKPEWENKELENYLKNGGKPKEEILAQNSEKANERRHRQGFISPDRVEKVWQFYQDSKNQS